MQTKSLVAICCVLLAALCAVVLAAPPQPMDLRTSNYTFDDFLKDFPREYNQSNNPDEYIQRKAIFEAELAAIIAHNQSGKSWVQGINQFSDLTDEEFIANYTGEHLPSESLHALHRDREVRLADELLGGSEAPSLTADMTGLPISVDWSNRILTNAAREQKKCGSCYSQVASQLLEAYLHPLAGKSIPLSTQQAVSCFLNPRKCGGSGGCAGYTSGAVMDGLAKDTGIVSEADYPYVSGAGEVPACTFDPEKMHVVVKTNGAKRLTPNDPTELLRHLAFIGPLSVSLGATAIKKYAGGVLTECYDGPYNEEWKMRENTINHAMLLVGYGVTADGVGYYKLRNSWGDAWGNDSFVYVHRPIGTPEQQLINLNPSSGYHCQDEDLSPVVVAGSCGLLANTWYPLDLTYFP